MKITHTSVYDGPNLYALFPVIRHRLGLGALGTWPTSRLGSSLVDRLVEHLPGLREDGRWSGLADSVLGGSIDNQGVRVVQLMERVAIALQRLAGADVSFGETRATGEPGIYDMFYEYEERTAGLAAALLALALVHHLLPEEFVEPNARDAGFDFPKALDAFQRFTELRAFNFNAMVLVREAQDRGIPWMCLDDRQHFQLGYGRQQRRILGSDSGANRPGAVKTSLNKAKTNQLLRNRGLPVPDQKLVYTRADAIKTAGRIGYPVVVKPLASTQGRGASPRLTGPVEVENAFDQAREHSLGVLIEAFIDGHDYRMLVVDGELIAAARRIPGHVVGDGKRAIEALLEEVNRDPRRGVGHEKMLTRLELDQQANRQLQQRGYTKDSVPAAGERVSLRATANLSTGGTAVDVTDVVHPDNRELAVRAVKVIGLNVGGVDFLTADISRSYKEIGGAICEINAAPGMRMHIAPSEGIPRNIAGPILNLLFPPGNPSRIPIAAITGTNGKTTTARMVAHILKCADYTVGLTTTDGAYIDGELLEKGDMAGAPAARMILRDPRVDAAVLETARGGLIKYGMGYDRCTVGTVLNVSDDHVGFDGIDSVEQMAEVKRVVVLAAEDTAVLNADDDLCIAMAKHTEARHVCYVTLKERHPLVAEHVGAGGRAVTLEAERDKLTIVLYDGPARVSILPVGHIPVTLDGRAAHNVQNAMFAAATASALGVGPEDIRRGLGEFRCTYEMAPGRLNFFDGHPFKVLLDWAHNAAAIEAMCRVVEQVPTRGGRLCTLGAPGNRLDEHIADMGRAAAGNFDHYILCSWDDLRGRGPEEVPQLIREGLIANGVAETNITIIPEEEKAVAAGLHLAREGDLLVTFVHDIDRAWRQINDFAAIATTGRDVQGK